MVSVNITCQGGCRPVRPIQVHADDYDALLRGVVRVNGFGYLTRADRELLLFKICASCRQKDLLPEDSGSRIGNLARAIRDLVPLVLTVDQRQQLATATATRLVRLEVLAVPGEVDAWMDEATGK